MLAARVFKAVTTPHTVQRDLFHALVLNTWDNKTGIGLKISP